MNNNKINVLLLGASGLLGQTLLPVLIKNKFLNVIEHSRSSKSEHQADVTNLIEVFGMLDSVQPEVIINLIGLTDVDLCESKPNQAYLTNVHSVENVVSWIKKNKSKCHLIHISTDQLYDGLGPHNESEIKLKNYYAFSKYAGELVAMRVNSTILRTNFFGYSHCLNRTSLTDWLSDELSKNNHIQVFDDVLFNPLSMITLSKFLNLCIQKRPKGVFNLGSHDGLSKADFAFFFAKTLGLPINTMNRVSSKDVTFLKTYRPKDMRMNCLKFENTLDINLPSLTEEIELASREYCE